MARDFTAASSHTVNYGDIGDLGTNKITLACWMYPDSFATSYGLINKRSAHNSANAYSMGVGYTATNRWELQLGNAANTAVGANYYATRSEATSQWYHVCMTYDGSLSAGSRCAIYIDGVSKTVTAGTDANVTPGNAASDLVLGRVNNTGSFYFDGRMAEAAIWDVALSAEEAAALADRAAPILVRPANLAFYAPLVRSLHDVMSGTAGTSSAAVIEHPPMRYPGRVHVVKATAAGGAVVIDLTSASFGFTGSSQQPKVQLPLTTASTDFTANSIQPKTTVGLTAAAFSFTANAINLGGQTIIDLSRATFNFTANAVNVIKDTVIDLTAAAFNFAAKVINISTPPISGGGSSGGMFMALAGFFKKRRYRQKVGKYE